MGGQRANGQVMTQNAFVISDLHQYVFGLFLGREKDSVVNLESLELLGTAFFVTKGGDAVTAAHTLPSAAQLRDDQCVLGILNEGGEPKAYRVIMSANFESSDFAILRLAVDSSKYFEIDFEETLAGTDIVAFGISEHQVYGQGYELRTLKGYTTMPILKGTQELSFPVPSGMSGGPVLRGSACVGFLIGNVSSEQLIDQIEEVQEITDTFEKIKIVQSKEVLHYGLYRPFSIFKGHKSDIFEGRSLDELISDRNQL